MEEEKWIALSGCNACINTALCHHLGNCALLTTDALLPDNNKRKRDYIKKLRGGITRPDLFAQEMKMKLVSSWSVPETTPKAWPGDEDGKYRQTETIKRSNYKVRSTEKTYRTWDGPVTLTRLEKMFLAELNKPR